MKAIILAGGFGTRLREVVSDVPKPMAMVGGKPFLEYLVMQLKEQGIHEIIFSTGYKGELIAKYFGDGHKWGCRFDYVQEDVPLGTGGAIQEAFSVINEEQVLVMNGDSLCLFDLSALTNLHEARNACVTMTLVEVSDMARYGAVEIDANEAVTRFFEKGQEGLGLINGGIYLLNRAVLSLLPKGTSSFEQDLLPLLISKSLFACVSDGFFIDIGVPVDYLRLCKIAESNQLDKIVNSNRCN